MGRLAMGAVHRSQRSTRCRIAATSSDSTVCTGCPPGAWSTNRHWHRTNDELVVVISGELVLVTDEGEEVLRAGDCVGFKAGVPNAHHMQNRSDEVAVYYDVGGRDAWDVSTFPDIGLEARSHMEIRFREIGDKA